MSEELAVRLCSIETIEVFFYVLKNILHELPLLIVHHKTLTTYFTGKSFSSL